MKTDNRIVKQISRRDLLHGRARAQRKQIQLLLDDDEVTSVIILESSNGAGQRLITVGPQLEFTSLKAVEQGFSGEGFRLVAFVDCRNKDLIAQGRTRFPWAEESDPSTETEGDQFGKTDAGNPPLEQRKTEAGLKKWELELQELAEALKRQEDGLSQVEEDLLDRMNQHLVKEAELEQWEENLFERERHLEEQKKQLTKNGVA